MSFLTNLFGKAETKSIKLNDSEAFALFGSVPTASGIHVSGNSALRVPAVACAVALIAETCGTLPFKLYSREDKQADTAHPAYRLVHDEANEWTSAEQLRTELTTDALLTGNGYALIIRLANGTPYEMHRLDPHKVRLDHAPDGEPFYVVNTDSGDVAHNFRDILHIQPFGGTSPIALAREVIALTLAFEQHVATLFANGGRPSGIIKAEKALDVDAKRKIAGSWFNTHSGRNAGGTAILDEGMSYEQLSLTLADAQFADNRIEQIREIARAFRVPPTMLFELTRGTWSNTEEMARQILSVTLRPWLNRWAFAYARCLLTPDERLTHYIEAVTDDLLTTNHAARATAYGQYRSMGVMSANEVRGGLNLPKRPDGDDLANPYTTSGPATDPATPDDDEEGAAQ